VESGEETGGHWVELDEGIGGEVRPGEGMEKGGVELGEHEMGVQGGVNWD
jgi:hypothetical protein